MEIHPKAPHQMVIDVDYDLSNLETNNHLDLFN